MENIDLLAVLDSLGSPRMLVVGDFILDRYTWGNAERISQEAPVILLRADRQEQKLGGAGNVCQMLHGLGAQVSCAGILGQDEPGTCLRGMLEGLGIDCQMLYSDSTRSTTIKQRFMGRAANRHPHQILRVDSEMRDAISPALEKELIRNIVGNIINFDVVLISDYAKGLVTPSLMRAVLAEAKKHCIPVIVDPVRTRDYRMYRGATLITPNRAEAKEATGLPIDNPSDALEVARRLCEIVDLEMAIVTLDRDGMVLAQADGQAELFPTDPRAVYDITGAGDVVIATIGICIAAGCTGEIGVRLANLAAGIAVEQMGASMVYRTDLRSYLLTQHRPVDLKLHDLDQLACIVKTAQAQGKRVAFTNGCFDLLHVGHISYLQKAAAMGDLLVVGLNSDQSVRQLKGPKRPVICEADRAAILSALQCVDLVTIFDSLDPLNVIDLIRPDVLVKGGDYRLEEVIGRDLVEAYGGMVVIAPLVEGVSTTRILQSAVA